MREIITITIACPQPDIHHLSRFAQAYSIHYLLNGQGASLKEMTRKIYDAIFLCLAPGLFSDCTSKIIFS